MNSNKFSYQGQIETILHYLNSMIQKNWTGKTADEFNRLMSIPELAKIACMSARNTSIYHSHTYGIRPAITQR